MVNIRLVWTLERSGGFHQHQYGFRKCRSTIDSLLRLDSYIKHAFARKEHVIAVFFDIEKAYDTTWRHNILLTLRHLGIGGHMARFVQNFLLERDMRVWVGCTLSGTYPQLEGVPQGSVLSCTLFALAINSLPDCAPRYVEGSLYVDDFAVYTSSASFPAAERRIQLTLNRVSAWADANGFTISLTKTVSMHFTRIRGVFPSPTLMFGQHQLRHVRETKFLGMILDPKLNWTLHLKYIRQRCLKSLDLLKCISAFTWGADRITLLRVYRALIRSCLDYGCQIYSSATAKSLKMVDAVHHQAIRICTGAFHSSPITSSLYAESGEPSLGYRRDKLSLQLYSRLCDVSHTPAHCFGL